MITLTTKRLTIRPLCTGDLEAVYRYASDAENTRYMMFYPHEDMQETKVFLQNAEAEWQKDSPAYYEFAVLSGERIIGGVTLYRTAVKDEGEFGWLIDKAYQGNGFAGEAVCAIMEFAKQRLQLCSFIAQCDHRNTASNALAKKLGMTLVDADGMRTYPKSGETAREFTYRLDFRKDSF